MDRKDWGKKVGLINNNRQYCIRVNKRLGELLIKGQSSDDAKMYENEGGSRREKDKW